MNFVPTEKKALNAKGRLAKAPTRTIRAGEEKKGPIRVKEGVGLRGKDHNRTTTREQHPGGRRKPVGKGGGTMCGIRKKKRTLNITILRSPKRT